MLALRGIRPRPPAATSSAATSGVTTSGVTTSSITTSSITTSSITTSSITTSSITTSSITTSGVTTSSVTTIAITVPTVPTVPTIPAIPAIPASAAVAATFQVLQGAPQRFDLAFISVLLHLGQFERFQHFLHVIKGVLQLGDDAVHVLDGVGHGLRLGGTEVLARHPVNHLTLLPAEAFARLASKLLARLRL